MTVVQTKFSRTYFENLRRKELGKLGTATRDLFHFISEFGKLHSVQNDIRVYFLIKKIQKIKTDPCGVFQLYFYENLFSPSHKNDIINNIKLTKNNFHKFLIEIFSLDKEVNKEKNGSFIPE